MSHRWRCVCGGGGGGGSHRILYEKAGEYNQSWQFSIIAAAEPGDASHLPLVYGSTAQLVTSARRGPPGNHIYLQLALSTLSVIDTSFQARRSRCLIPKQPSKSAPY